MNIKLSRKGKRNGMHGVHRFGSLNPFFGKKHSEETKEKLRNARKGKVTSEETKNKIKISLKGRPVPWLKGKKLSKSHIKKISIAGKGRKMTEDHRRKLSESHKGEKSHLWKGGITKKNMMIRSSLEYKLWRESIFKRDNYQCVLGGKEHGNKLNADHIKSFAHYPELRFVLENGRTLCEKCHRKTDNYGTRNIKPINGTINK